MASQPKTDVLREYRWTAPWFYRAAEAGAFGLWPKVELFRGRLIEHPGQTPAHAYVVGHIAHCFRAVLEPAFRVCESYPFAASENSHLDTDILVVTGNQHAYREQHPGPADVILLVEAADLTAAYDLGEKAHLYAEVGVQDYWVVLVSKNAVVVHRDPTPNGYSTVTRLAGEETLSPLALPEAVWTIDTLLGR